MPTTDTGASRTKSAASRISMCPAPGKSRSREITPMWAHPEPGSARHTIIDIADPYHPRVVATVTLDDPTSHSHKVASSAT